MKVRITKHNGIHNLAQCQERGCGWGCDQFGGGGKFTNKQVAAECLKHARKTGHRVIREVANSIHYDPV